jgi:hypothetical protein
MPFFTDEPNDLPPCRWRGPSTRTGFYPCSSQKIIAFQGVTGEICKQCPFVDHEESAVQYLPDLTVRQPTPKPVGKGPGTELKKMLAEYGVAQQAGCMCDAKAEQMDGWGVAGCLENRNDLVEGLKVEWGKLGLLERARIAARAISKGFIHPLDPIGALVDEAIKRAGEQT